MLDPTAFGDLEGSNVFTCFASAVTTSSLGGASCAGFAGRLETLRRDLPVGSAGLLLWYADLPL